MSYAKFPDRPSADKGKPLLGDTASGPADEQQRYTEQQKRAQDAVKNIQNHVAEIQKQTQQLNFPNAIASVGETRPKVQEAVKAAQDIAQEADALLKGIIVDAKGVSTQEQNMRKAKQQKLTESLNQSAAAVQVALKAYERREAELSLKAAEEAQTSASTSASTLSSTSSRPMGKAHARGGKSNARQFDPNDAKAMVELEQGGFPQRGVSLQAMETSEAEVDMHGELVTEFTQEVTTLEEDVRSLAHSMRQVAGMVQDQGEVLDNIETNMGNAEEDSAGATEQLVQASQTQQRGTKRIWYLLAVVMLLSIILVCILIARAKRK